MFFMVVSYENICCAPVHETVRMDPWMEERKGLPCPEWLGWISRFVSASGTLGVPVPQGVTSPQSDASTEHMVVPRGKLIPNPVSHDSTMLEWSWWRTGGRGQLAPTYQDFFSGKLPRMRRECICNLRFPMGAPGLGVYRCGCLSQARR